MTTGLVLSGGGAKGAYQVGVMKALLEMNISIDMISGASIGALNGAVLASAPNLNIGTERLSQLWHQLYETNPLQFNINNKEKVLQAITYLSFLVSTGLNVSKPISKIITATAWAKNYSKIHSLLNSHSISLLGLPLSALLSDKKDGNALLTDDVLLKKIDQFLDLEQLQYSLPLYVSVFPQESYLKSTLEIIGAEFLGIENSFSQFKKIQSLAQEEQKEMLLASAAIPLLFATKKDRAGNIWSDGGQGGWIKSQGNTPITPLITSGCQYVIISHLNNGSLWHRHDFPAVTCVEIRPNPNIDLGMKAMFNFSKEKILQLMDFGYEDTIKSLQPIYKTLQILGESKKAIHENQLALKALKSTEENMKNAMAKLQEKF